MPVDFLSDSEAAKYGRYDGPPSRAEMEKIFFLDNEDRGDQHLRPHFQEFACAGADRR
ncbi:hypothetical protein ACI2LC_37585 [Nonomuraea wenchangensis]|uniref:hypothetical protein n=1 Tax=Nonomuraea wenchangensis TaxID=568860 RepID=UPI0033F2728C